MVLVWPLRSVNKGRIFFWKSRLVGGGRLTSHNGSQQGVKSHFFEHEAQKNSHIIHYQP